MGERFPEIDWYCDRCNAYLNEQEGFDEKFHVIGHHTATGNIPRFIDELRLSGDLQLDMAVFVPEE